MARPGFTPTARSVGVSLTPACSLKPVCNANVPAFHLMQLRAPHRGFRRATVVCNAAASECRACDGGEAYSHVHTAHPRMRKRLSPAVFPLPSASRAACQFW
jgi:hypothetical protein